MWHKDHVESNEGIQSVNCEKVYFPSCSSISKKELFLSERPCIREGEACGETGWFSGRQLPVLGTEMACSVGKRGQIRRAGIRSVKAFMC